MLDLNQKTDYDHLNYDQLVLIYKKCQACELSKYRNHVVVGHGNIPSHIMIIGEGPGVQEDLEGKPFVGRSGQLLVKLLSSVGIDRDKEVYIANTVACRPPGNRTPHRTEIETCQHYLLRQIHIVQPKILLLLGNPSLKMVLGQQFGITKVRGQWFNQAVTYMTDPLYIMPLFHPAYLLRNASKNNGSPQWLTRQDLQKVKDLLMLNSMPSYFTVESQSVEASPF